MMNSQLVKFSVNDSPNQSSLRHKSKRSELIPYFLPIVLLKSEATGCLKLEFQTKLTVNAQLEDSGSNPHMRRMGGKSTIFLNQNK
jgi:hypothetical protein